MTPSVGRIALALVLAAPSGASAATYEVGPSRTYTQLADVAPLLNPGDEVTLDGGATYDAVTFDRPGSKEQSIVIRGVPVDGRRPVISGGRNTIEFAGDHYVAENLDVTGGSSRCIYHHADDITVRGTVVHDCPVNGILGADEDSGSLTLAYDEIYRCGSGTQAHQIYMSSDENAHPGSVFRLEHTYIHDGRGGNNVKSRAERNEIYYNWIEGATYHELELIGPDSSVGAPEDKAREDSDVVGNVVIKRNDFYVARFGGDGTGQTNGRYRFAFNTVVAQRDGSAVFRLFDGLDSVEMHGNAFVAGDLVRDAEASWASGARVVSGAGNWVANGAANVPPEWTGTVHGDNPGFVDAAGDDIRPAEGSPLIDSGPLATPSPDGHAFPAPLAAPAFAPPLRAPEAVDSALPRVVDSHIDIGAFDYPAPGAFAPRDTTAPLISALSLSRRRFTRSTTLRFQLSEAGDVRFTVERRRGRRYLRVRRFTQTAAAGGVSTRFSARRLVPGLYRVTLVATDRAGNASTPARIRFRVAT